MPQPHPRLGIWQMLIAINSAIPLLHTPLPPSLTQWCQLFYHSRGPNNFPITAVDYANVLTLLSKIRADPTDDPDAYFTGPDCFAQVAAFAAELRSPIPPPPGTPAAHPALRLKNQTPVHAPYPDPTATLAGMRLCLDKI